MKLKTTKKVIKENYSKIIGIGYCNAQTLLKYENEFGYSAGQNGWACDYYEINNVCISTGYAPLRGIEYSYDILNEYEKQAQNIDSDYSKTWEERKERIQPLIRQFINEILKGGEII